MILSFSILATAQVLTCSAYSVLHLNLWHGTVVLVWGMISYLVGDTFSQNQKEFCIFNHFIQERKWELAALRLLRERCLNTAHATLTLSFPGALRAMSTFTQCSCTVFPNFRHWCMYSWPAPFDVWKNFVTTSLAIYTLDTSTCTDTISQGFVELKVFLYHIFEYIG